MSEAPGGEDGREEADQRKAEVGGGNGPTGAGGNRVSVTSNSGEGSTQQEQQQQVEPPTEPPLQPPPQQPPHKLLPSQAQESSPTQQQQPAAEPPTEKKEVKRHVEASPQGRYLRFEDKLGTGQYKVVYRSYDTSMGIEVAWNTVNIKNLPKDEKKRIMNEVRLLQNLEHKNLVQFHGSWVNREREEVIFVTEIMQSGSLME